MAQTNRRLFLLGGAAAAGATVLPSWALASSAVAAPAIPYPFQLGVASGDPRPDTVVLWTRLAPGPLNPDGNGGMPDATFNVDWEVATDENFATVTASGTVATSRAIGYSVHVEPALQAGREYFYRFKTGGHISPVGRTRTAPAVGSTPAQVRFCMTSCQHFEKAWYHAYGGIVTDIPDLVLFLGDYMYEKSSAAGAVRRYTITDEVTTLADYRQRYAQHRTDPNLQAAHAAAPWLVVFDDHEVDNNYNRTTPGATRKAAAYQAYYENMPLRAAAKPSGSSIPLYRQFLWGSLARFHMLDTRQYRDAQAAVGDCTTMRSTSRTMVGSAQEQWLLSAFDAHPATWDFIGQQVMFSQRDGDGLRGSGSTGCSDNIRDAWDGYTASRDRIANGWVDRSLPNPVVLSGDVHRHWAADLRVDYYDHSAPIIGSELTTTSVSSGGNTTNDPPSSTWWSYNPHVKYYMNKRGYVRVTATPQSTTADFRVVSNPTIYDPEQVTISTSASYVLMAGTRGLQRV